MHTYIHACMHAYTHTCIHTFVHICWRGYRQFRQCLQRQIKIFNAAISYRLCLNLSVIWQKYLKNFIIYMPVLMPCLRLNLTWWICFRKHNIYIWTFYHFSKLKWCKASSWKIPRTQQGPCLNTNTVFLRYRIPMLKIRRSRDCLVFSLTWWSLYS